MSRPSLQLLSGDDTSLVDTFVWKDFSTIGLMGYTSRKWEGVLKLLLHKYIVERKLADENLSDADRRATLRNFIRNSDFKQHAKKFETFVKYCCYQILDTADPKWIKDNPTVFIPLVDSAKKCADQMKNQQHLAPPDKDTLRYIASDNIEPMERLTAFRRIENRDLLTRLLVEMSICCSQESHTLAQCARVIFRGDSRDNDAATPNMSADIVQSFLLNHLTYQQLSDAFSDLIWLAEKRNDVCHVRGQHGMLDVDEVYRRYRQLVKCSGLLETTFHGMLPIAEVSLLLFLRQVTLQRAAAISFHSGVWGFIQLSQL